MDLYSQFPPEGGLLQISENSDFVVRKVNNHFHTPYSFSAFTEMSQVLQMAEEEGISVLGINDFYTMAGYEEFAKLCARHKKFPLFNIEFMGLLRKEQENGTRVNDPNNPGRTYFCGKGLDYPPNLGGTSLEKLTNVRAESEKQTKVMVEKAADHLHQADPQLKLDYESILNKHTKGMVRERHIAKAIRILLEQKYKDADLRKAKLNKIYGNRKSSVDLNDAASLEGEIRSVLLKSGGPAFVKEDPHAFLDISEVIKIILDAGGIPCYPVLLDDKDGNFTKFEENMERLYERLISLKVFSLELIPGRNHSKFLKPFVEFFDKKGFVITFGTEHNTPALEPLTVRSADAPLDDYLCRVSYKGACVIAAHQYLRSKGRIGYVDQNGIPVNEMDRFVRTGNAVISYFTSGKVL
ncbi:MAG: PHP domain-containing protein [Bacteroidales bacterium]|nr:PHP domain-containing protein [Bacteroidales bacterium]